ncbi:MAG: extracellular solute-binding protein, partial [bacterium]|nr:extracellular solute-binding protein [bacterium]
MIRPSKIFFFLGLTALLTLTGLRCTRGTPPEIEKANRPVTLTWWRVFDDESAVRPIIEAYRGNHPNVTIQYRKLRFEEYERELLNALAEDRGPDIISLHNTWVRAWLPKITPLPAEITLPFQELRGTLKKEVVTSLKTTPTLSSRGLKSLFVDTVAADVLISERDEQGGVKENIWGLPLALDTLVLYANRDLLNIAGVPEVPKTWDDLQAVTSRLTKINDRNEPIQSAVALGTSKNIDRGADILALLMMQNGTEMIDAAGRAAFQRIPQALQGISTPPGEQALSFYADFANPNKESYTWSARQPNSFEAFVSGRVALFFGYGYHLPLLRARAPRMNLEISRMPQIEGNPEINFANYWIEAVSKKSPNTEWAWDFLQFATKENQVKPYLEAVKKPTALRALVAQQLSDEDIGTFAEQLLTAKTWYRGLSA